MGNSFPEHWSTHDLVSDFIVHTETNFYIKIIQIVDSFKCA